MSDLYDMAERIADTQELERLRAENKRLRRRIALLTHVLEGQTMRATNAAILQAQMGYTGQGLVQHFWHESDGLRNASPLGLLLGSRLI